MAGALLDILATMDVQAVAKNQALKSASVSWIGTIIAYAMFYNIITGPDFLLGIIVYASGGFAGTMFIMRLKSIQHILEKGLTWIETQTMIPEEEILNPDLHHPKLSSGIVSSEQNTLNLFPLETGQEQMPNNISLNSGESQSTQ